jgi:arsenate reductase (thioredoxin)
MIGRKKVLFLCTGNSCRSQMAEGFARALRGEIIEAYSAGVMPQGVNPLAIKVMGECGVDISSHTSKNVEDLRPIPFDYVITVCDSANQECPIWIGKGKKLHHSFDDPPRLAANAKSETEALQAYRRVRDEIKSFIETLPQGLERV